MRTLLPAIRLIPCMSAMSLMLTSRFGVVMSSFISESRSVPPASTSTSPQFLPKRGITCSLVLGLEYSNGCMATSLIERCHDAIGRDGQERHAHANGVGYGIGNRSRRPDRRWLAQANRPALVVSLAGHHVHDQLRNIADAGQPVEIHIGIQHP